MNLQEKIKALAAQYKNEFIAVRHQLHANPELSFQEFETSKFVQQKLTDLQIPFTIMAKTGVVAIIEGKNPKERIIALLDSVEKMVERKQMKKVMDYVSMEYRDDQNRKYNDIRDYLQSIARDYRVIRITRTIPEVKIEGNKASVLDTFGTVAEPYDPVNEVPVNLQGRVIITLQKETDGWKIVSWSPLL